MKKRYLTFIIICVLLFLVIYIISNNNIKFTTKSNSIEIEHNTISISEMNMDLYYLEKQVIDNHPALKDKDTLDRFKGKMDYAYEKIDSIKSNDEFVFLVMEILATLKDGHTAVDLYNGSYNAIDLNFKWLDEGMIINEGNEVLKKGDKVLKIGNMKPEQILLNMKKFIPSENDYWLKYKSEQFLPTKMFLNHLGLINNKDKVDVLVEDYNGKIKNVQLSFNNYISIMEKYYNLRPFYYEINNNKSIGIFYLNFCIYNEQYIKKVEEFFHDIKKDRIEKAVIDLRKNSGGNAVVIGEFLQYINVEKVELLNDVWFSNSINEQTDLFNGEIYVLTSKETFSAAHGFAGVFKNNNIGLIVGEPTGNATLAYGNAPRCELPNSKIEFNVATDIFKIPNKGAYSNTLEPDIYITYTRQDIILSNDPIIEWVIDCN
ncbi:S41 family peptidase [Proteiniborus sp. MB09-C3]|uniref:S41 family peptidase n=1 Tax=Proteiniborus sp. MB09-C3 TaxID=3050072 RepID=UPI0025560BA7|nr:S41 family peptidase [Proteiniborus sp. MB09-C3]WIV13446.1 S41 family peptidase [Proteiniborus sp. MB09-C3]